VVLPSENQELPDNIKTFKNLRCFQTINQDNGSLLQHPDARYYFRIGR
jgi:hypothetical protein